MDEDDTLFEIIEFKLNPSRAGSAAQAGRLPYFEC